MLTIDSKIFIFNQREIWFEDKPSNISGTDKAVFRNCTSSECPDGFTKEPFTTLSIDLSTDQQTIFKGFNSTCRNQIRKGEKNEIDITFGGFENEFCTLYQHFAKDKRLNALPITPEFLKTKGLLFTAHKNDCLIAGSFFLSNGAVIRLYINASKRLDENAGIDRNSIGYASRMLMWEAIKYGCNNGFKEFDLGGYYTGEQPDPDKEKINFFKEGFSKNIVTRYTYTKFYSPIYKLLSKLAGAMKRS